MLCSVKQIPTIRIPPKEKRADCRAELHQLKLHEERLEFELRRAELLLSRIAKREALAHRCYV